MKSTGIVRRIDDLGRVVIPKEIRRTLRIREGEPLEIFTGQEGEIFLKKYSPIGELKKYAKELAESIAQATNHLVCIADKDRIVAASGLSSKDYYGAEISEELEEIVNEREMQVFEAAKNDGIRLTRGDRQTMEPMVVQPIISAGDAIGAVIIIGSKETVGKPEVKVAQVAAGFLGKQMEG